MMAWMNAETLQMTLDEGRMVYWSRSRQEVWRKGDTSGDRQYVREAYYDCDADVLLFKVDQEGKGACHTGARTCFFRRFGPSRAAMTELHDAAEPRRVPLAGRRAHRRAGVDRAARRPRDAGRRVRQARRRRHRASCSSRSSTASAGAGSASSGATRSATLMLRDGTVEVDGELPASVPTDAGMLAALDALLAHVPRADHPRPAAAAGRGDGVTSATTSSARSSACPTCRTTTATCPTR